MYLATILLSYQFIGLAIITTNTHDLILWKIWARLSCHILILRLTVGFKLLSLLLNNVTIHTIAYYSPRHLRLIHAMIIITILWLHLARARHYNSIHRRDVLLIDHTLAWLVLLMLTSQHLLMLGPLMSLCLANSARCQVCIILNLIIIIKKMITHIRLTCVAVTRVHMACLRATCTAKHKLDRCVWLLTRKNIIVVVWTKIVG